MTDQADCSVVLEDSQVAFLGKGDDQGLGPFFWPLLALPNSLADGSCGPPCFRSSTGMCFLHLCLQYWHVPSPCWCWVYCPGTWCLVSACNYKVLGTTQSIFSKPVSLVRKEPFLSNRFFLAVLLIAFSECQTQSCCCPLSCLC